MDCRLVLIAALMMAMSCLVVQGDMLRPTCACARIYQPVCASHGVTYNNMCEFQCNAKYLKEKFGRNVMVAGTGRCDGSY